MNQTRRHLLMTILGSMAVIPLASGQAAAMSWRFSPPPPPPPPPGQAKANAIKQAIQNFKGSPGQLKAMIVSQLQTVPKNELANTIRFLGSNLGGLSPQMVSALGNALTDVSTAIAKGTFPGTQGTSAADRTALLKSVEAAVSTSPALNSVYQPAAAESALKSQQGQSTPAPSSQQPSQQPSPTPVSPLTPGSSGGGGSSGSKT